MVGKMGLPRSLVALMRRRLRRGRGARKHDGRSRSNTLPFLNYDRLVWLNVRNQILLAVEPDDFQRHSSPFFRRTKPKGQRQLALGTITGAGLNQTKELSFG